MGDMRRLPLRTAVIGTLGSHMSLNFRRLLASHMGAYQCYLPEICDP